jgi:hypothetical protein
MLARLLACAATLGLAAAQSPLNTIPTPAPTAWFLWTGCVEPMVFFNLTVNTPVTVQGLEVRLDNLAGFDGSIDVYVTNPGITTHAGNETNAATWTLRASGPVTAAGQVTPVRVGLMPGIVLQPGTYGIGVRYRGVRAEFLQGTGANQTFSTAELTLTAGSVQALAFTSAAATPFVWLGRIHYAVGNVAHAAAAHTSFGTGCNAVHGSFYQRFACSTTAAAALNGRSISLVPTGNGYVVVPGTGVTFVAPTAAAGALPANDDGETMVALTNPLPIPGGSTQQLFVHTNGYVSVASNTAPLPNNFTPFVPGLLGAPATAWWSWHDYNAAEAGSGTIKFEEVGSLVLITWQDVESWPAVQGTTPVVNRSTWQFQFDTATGIVNYVWQTITPQGTSVDGDEHVVGYSPGGPSPDNGPIDITTLTSVALTQPEVLPLRLAATGLPTLGNPVNYVTSNETGQNLGLFFFCTQAIPSPGFDLTVLGMPGCAAHVDIATGVGNVISNLGLPGSSMTVTLPIPATPASLLGAEFVGQSVWLDPTANAFGATTSNGLRTRLGGF